MKSTPDWTKCHISNLVSGKSWIPKDGVLKRVPTLNLTDDLSLTRDQAKRALDAISKTATDCVLVVGFSESVGWKETVGIKAPWQEVHITHFNEGWDGLE